VTEFGKAHGRGSGRSSPVAASMLQPRRVGRRQATGRLPPAQTLAWPAPGTTSRVWMCTS